MSLVRWDAPFHVPVPALMRTPHHTNGKCLLGQALEVRGVAPETLPRFEMKARRFVVEGGGDPSRRQETDRRQEE